MGFIETQIVFAIVSIGFYYYVSRAWKERKDSLLLKSFFLGGGRIGPSLTEYNTIGMTFAWSGGIWFFATIAFAFGPWVLLMQLPWCASLIILALLFTKIHRVTKNKTIHGFLEDSYGSKVRKVASFATTLGYIFNTGFELYWSGFLLSTILGYPELALPIGIIFGLIAAIYCSIGGYKANAATDKMQNILGIVALSMLNLFVVFHGNSWPLQVAGVVFAIGSLIYIVFSFVFPGSLSNNQSKTISIYAIIIAIASIIIAISLSNYNSPVEPEIFKNTPFPVHLFVGLIVFQLFFNVVDMANWQGIAANGDIEESKHGQLKWALVRSGLFLNWFPALGGVIIGLALRSGFTGVTDDNIFQIAFSTVLPEGNIILRGVILGILILGFVSSALSTADSYLMSATHTITYDFLYHDQIRKLIESEGDELQEAYFVKKAKRFLLPLSLIMVLFFWLALESYKKVGGNAFDFQMIMYSFALSLLPSVVYSIFRGLEVSKKNAFFSLLSIVFGILTAVLPYLTIVLSGGKSETRSILVNLTPVFSLAVSSAFFLTGLFLKKVKTDE